jgi:hypothetical protein
MAQDWANVYRSELERNPGSPLAAVGRSSWKPQNSF